MTNGLGKVSLLVLIISLYLEKKDFQENTPKIQMLMFVLPQEPHSGL